MRYLGLAEVLALHRRIIDTSGGGQGLRDLGRLQSAVAQPRATFDGADLYPDLIEKACALCFSLVQGHPFVDGNKRIGHAAMETMLVINGTELHASVDDAEQIILRLASGRLSREELVVWARVHSAPLTPAQ